MLKITVRSWTKLCVRLVLLEEESRVTRIACLNLRELSPVRVFHF